MIMERDLGGRVLAGAGVTTTRHRQPPNVRCAALAPGSAVLPMVDSGVYRLLIISTGYFAATLLLVILRTADIVSWLQADQSIAGSRYRRRLAAANKLAVQ